MSWVSYTRFESWNLNDSLLYQISVTTQVNLSLILHHLDWILFEKIPISLHSPLHSAWYLKTEEKLNKTVTTQYGNNDSGIGIKT